MENSFISNLDEWIKVQKNLLELIKQRGDKEEGGDRLDLILDSRYAFQHMMRTLKAFDQWLQDPLVIKHMPKEMLIDVQKTSWSILLQLLELDIRHTSQFKDIITKLKDSDQLDPLIWIKQPEEQNQGQSTGRRNTFPMI
ncbi:hypothetical protein HS7_17020 [Sulfolobales archaeon HS-7]|nr:hypothetical protein HS7_17020 [Sulfolobales archaeon HS-7]